MPLSLFEARGVGEILLIFLPVGGECYFLRHSSLGRAVVRVEMLREFQIYLKLRATLEVMFNRTTWIEFVIQAANRLCAVLFFQSPKSEMKTGNGIEVVRKGSIN